MKHFLTLFIMFGVMFNSTAFAVDEDDYDYDAMLTSDDNIDEKVTSGGGDVECSLTHVDLNSDAEPIAVANFDVAGIMIGMTFEEAQTAARETGLYENRQKNSVIYSLHHDWKDNLDYECRQQKIYAPEKLEKCIRSLARNRGLLYASELHLVRKRTGETIDVFFTSNTTNNTVWKIVYKNDVNELEGDGDKFANQRERKIMAFWQNVLDKYGSPNSQTDKWISSDNAYDPMMTATYGGLELTDCGRYADDDSKNVAESRKNFISKPYAF
ncbi:MAG: hypothetical protein K5912_03730 [Alphaproteobacteria bacterium]|nr:hypothetical protein [Alphaproteobacteria bacterium]